MLYATIEKVDNVSITMVNDNPYFNGEIPAYFTTRFMSVAIMWTKLLLHKFEPSLHNLTSNPVKQHLKYITVEVLQSKTSKQIGQVVTTLHNHYDNFYQEMEQKKMWEDEEKLTDPDFKDPFKKHKRGRKRKKQSKEDQEEERREKKKKRSRRHKNSEEDKDAPLPHVAKDTWKGQQQRRPTHSHLETNRLQSYIEDLYDIEGELNDCSPTTKITEKRMPRNMSNVVIEKMENGLFLDPIYYMQQIKPSMIIGIFEKYEAEYMYYHTLTTEDLSSLEGTKWLDQSIIDCVGVINEENWPNCTFVPIELTFMVFNRLYTLTASEFQNASLLRMKLKSTTETLLIPLYQSQHYTLLVVDVINSKVMHLDPKKHDNDECALESDAVLQFFTFIKKCKELGVLPLLTSKTWEPAINQFPNRPIQDDDVHCALYVIK